MKYMTRDRLDAFRNQDEKIAKASRDEWRIAMDRYRKYVHDVFESLPPAVREYLKEKARCTFHDEEITSLSYDKAQRCLLITAHERCILQYEEVNNVRVSDLNPSNENPTAWLYDEIELLSDGSVEFRILFEEGELSFLARSVAVRLL